MWTNPQETAEVAFLILDLVKIFLQLSIVLNKIISSKNFKTKVAINAWKASVFGVILVRIFPYLDWTRRDTP